MDIYALVERDLRNRNEQGKRRFGRPLMPDGPVCDGSRPTLVEAYEEALDLAIYLRKLIAEQHLMPS